MFVEQFWKVIEHVQQSSWSMNAISSVVLFVILVVARQIIVRHIRAAAYPLEVKRRWLIQLRNIVLLLVVFGFGLIWASELRTVAISLVAIAAAIVLATKELIMCISGAVLRRLSNAFSLGDRVEVGNFRGDVIDLGLFTTTILEVGPGHNIHQRTGRSCILPNSMLLSTPVINETFMDKYMLHVLCVPAELAMPLEQTENLLLAIAQEECAAFIGQAREQQQKMANKHGLDTPNVEPRVTVRISEVGTIELLLRFPVLVHRRGVIEQTILRRFLSEKPQHQTQPSHSFSSEKSKQSQAQTNSTMKV